MTPQSMENLKYWAVNWTAIDITHQFSPTHQPASSFAGSCIRAGWPAELSSGTPQHSQKHFTSCYGSDAA